jgi:ATP-dependent RNA helicase RhlE
MLVDRGRKSELLAHLVKEHNWFQVLVFTRTKHGANRLAEYLNKHGVTALAIHGNKSQGARTRALAEFKSGELQALVATDIAARGLDIEQLPHVVNFDLPHVPEDYVHRIGRTGRAGATGEAISLVCADDKPLLVDIEKLIRRQVAKEIVAGFEPNPNERAEPIMRGRGQAPGPRGNARRDAPQKQRPAKPARPAQPGRAPHSTRAAPARPAHAAPNPSHAARGPNPGTGSTHATHSHKQQPAAGRQNRQETSTVRTNIPSMVQTGHRRGR